MGAYGSSKVFIPNSTGDTRKLSEFEAAITQLPLSTRYVLQFPTVSLDDVLTAPIQRIPKMYPVVNPDVLTAPCIAYTQEMLFGWSP